MSKEKTGKTGKSEERDEFAEAEAQADAQLAASSGKKDDKAEEGEKELTPKEKAVKKMLHKAGVEKLPELKTLFAGKVGETVKVKDIGIFLGTPKDEILKELAKECPIRNRGNLSTEVSMAQVIKVGADILSVGRLVSPITLARIKEDGVLECTSGRHRLVAIALLYGADAEVTAYVENLTLTEARDTVVFANDCRATKAMEKAEHVVLKAVNGNVDVKQDELYAAVCTSKGKARKYAVYSVFERKHPAKLAFAVSFTASRKDGELTTLTNVENFWKAAVEWTSETERKVFDASLKASIEFLNALVEAMQTVKGFDAEQHLASMPLTAIGRFYREYGSIQGENAISVVKKVAKTVVELGEVGRQPSKKTYDAIAKAMQPK